MQKKETAWVKYTVGMAAVLILALLVSYVGGRRHAGLETGGVEGTSTGTAPRADQEVPPAVPLVQERMEDPVYVETLKAQVEERRAVIGEAAAVRERMEIRVAAAEAELIAEAQARGGPDVVAATVTEEAIQTRVQQHPEWAGLEAEQERIQARLAVIQHRTETIVRERMQQQYVQRQGPKVPVKPPPVIHVMPNEIQMETEPVIMDAPEGAGHTLPPLPDRRPVVWPERGNTP